MSDEIIRELWRIKDEIAKEFNCDIDALRCRANATTERTGTETRQFGAHKTEPATQEIGPRVKEVTPEADYRLRVVFTNGEIGIYDCRHLLDFGVFKELRDVDYFRQVHVENDTVSWPHEQDICSDTVYLNSVKTSAIAAGSGLNDRVNPN